VATSLLLSAGPGGMEWGVWQFTPATGKPTYGVTFELNAGGTDEAWLALADFAASEWVLSGPFSTTEMIDLSLNPEVLSPNGNIYVAVVASDNKLAIVDGITFYVEGNDPPIASFTATPQVGAPGEYTLLDGTGSSDGDGSIVSYEWDITGDGAYDTFGPSPTLDSALPYPSGVVTVGLRVTDDLGATGEATLDLESNGDVWQFAEVAVGNISNPSLAVINGTPALAFRNVDTSSLEFAYSTSADGLSGFTTTTVDPGETDEFNGYYCSLAEINGAPAISHTRVASAADTLQYAYSSTPDGSSGWSSVTIPTAFVQYTSLAPRPDGTPGINYYVWNGEDLHYAYSTVADGSSGWNTYSIEIGGTETGIYCSQELLNGKDCVSYCNSGVLKFARHDLGESGGGWIKEVVGSGPSGYYSSLAQLASGNPAIAYYNYNLNQLEYVWADNGGTDDDWHKVDVATGAMDGYACSLAVIGGIPMICYRGGSVDFSDLKLAVATDENGTAWNVSVIDTVGGDPDNYTAIAEVAGRPAVAYYSAAAGALKFAMLFRDDTP
jgi:hypothetical protein